MDPHDGHDERGESGEHLDEDVRATDREHAGEAPVGDLTDPADGPGEAESPSSPAA